MKVCSHGISEFLILMLLTAILVIPSHVSAENEVGITNEINSLDIQYAGKTVTIERNQDIDNKLTNSFAKTSRVCPPFCVQPMQIHSEVKTVGEVELLDFLDEQVKRNEGLLIDARLPEWFEKGTIPGSINIPFSILDTGIESAHAKRIIKLLGAEENDSRWSFDDVQALLLFCNGLWCGQSARAINNLIDMGYPPEKLFWYRGGMQSWQSLGLTVVTPN